MQSMAMRNCALLKVFVALLTCLHVSGTSTPINPSMTLLWGPGLHRNTTPLPINYFFIQARNDLGESISDCNEDAFHVELSTLNDRVRRRQKMDYLGSCLFLVQYRMYTDYSDIILTVTHAGEHVAESPYALGGMLVENCFCPLNTVEEWLNKFDCPSELDPQIAEDIQPFKKDGVNITGLYERAGEAYHSNSFIHYSLVDGKLYAQAFGSIIGFKFLSDMILLSIVSKVKLPDMELIVNLGDWPLNKKGPGRLPLPTFSWCGSEATWDIVWPTWDLMKSTIMGMDRVTLSMLSVQEAQKIPWASRDPRMFFRGRDSNKARLDLVKSHRRNTELFDVGIVAWFFFKHDEEIYGPIANRVGFNEFFKYKYQLNIDGTVAAYRLPFLMAGGSLIFKQDSDYYEHFYRKMVPWEHYIPVQRDLSNLMERLEWALSEDAKSEIMAVNAVKLANNHLLPDDLYCYLVRLLKEYADLVVGEAQVHLDMEQVKSEQMHECTQVCKQLQGRKEMKDEL